MISVDPPQIKDWAQAILLVSVLIALGCRPNAPAPAPSQFTTSPAERLGRLQQDLRDLDQIDFADVARIGAALDRLEADMRVAPQVPRSVEDLLNGVLVDGRMEIFGYKMLLSAAPEDFQADKKILVQEITLLHDSIAETLHQLGQPRLIETSPQK